MPKSELTLLTQYRLKTMYYVKGAYNMYNTCQASPKKIGPSCLVHHVLLSSSLFMLFQHIDIQRPKI